jgi:hypothetical protein
MKLLLPFFIFFSLNSFAQNSFSNVRSILTNADSVIIASHQSLFVPEKPIGTPAEKGKEIVVKGKPNYSIILKSCKLDHKSVDSLAFILTREADGNINQMACFDPHHTIYIFKKEALSFIDICFGCHRFSMSKDFKFGVYGLTDETWVELESFFEKHQIDNKKTF